MTNFEEPEKMSIYIEKRKKSLYKANLFEHVIFIYIILSILMFSFVNTLDATALHVIYVPYISGLIVYWHVFLTAGVISVYLLFGFLSNKSIKIDKLFIPTFKKEQFGGQNLSNTQRKLLHYLISNIYGVVIFNLFSKGKA